MIFVEPSIWDKIIRDHPKVKKFRNKPFPLFNYLATLYEATGDLNFVSIEQVEPPTDQVIPNDNDAHDVGLNPFSTNLEEQSTSSAHIEAKKVERVPSTSSRQKGDDNGKKRKQSQIAGVFESYLEFKKEQAKKFAEELNEQQDIVKVMIFLLGSVLLH